MSEALLAKGPTTDLVCDEQFHWGRERHTQRKYFLCDCDCDCGARERLCRLLSHEDNDRRVSAMRMLVSLLAHLEALFCSDGADGAGVNELAALRARFLKIKEGLL